MLQRYIYIYIYIYTYIYIYIYILLTSIWINKSYASLHLIFRVNTSTSIEDPNCNQPNMAFTDVLWFWKQNFWKVLLIELNCSTRIKNNNFFYIFQESSLESVYIVIWKTEILKAPEILEKNKTKAIKPKKKIKEKKISRLFWKLMSSTFHKNLTYIYIYIYIYVCECVCVCTGIV